MKTNAERFAELVPMFRLAIVDKIKEANPSGTYLPSTQALRVAAFAAIKEVVESEVEAVPPMLAVNVWNAVMLTNESAFHQGLERAISAGTVTGLKVVKGAKAVASGYFE